MSYAYIYVIVAASTNAYELNSFVIILQPVYCTNCRTLDLYKFCKTLIAMLCLLISDKIEIIALPPHLKRDFHKIPQITTITAVLTIKGEIFNDQSHSRHYFHHPSEYLSEM